MNEFQKKQLRSLSLRCHPQQRQALIVEGALRYIEKIEKENELLNDLINDLYHQIGKEGGGRDYIDQKRQKIDDKINRNN